jgi:hypothetical protein
MSPERPNKRARKIKKRIMRDKKSERRKRRQEG